jgi:hypothetical protein
MIAMRNLHTRSAAIGVIVVALGVTLLGLLSLAFAQLVQPDPLAPSTWFESPEALFAIGAVFAGWVVKLATALGKEWFRTNGQATVYLSGGISVAIAGFGGYFALGYLTGAGGFAGALQAAAMALLSWVGANASAKYDRQAAAAAAGRVERARTNLL